MVKHTERKAKMMMLHEIEMKKLQQKVYSGKVQDKKNELAERKRKDKIAKMQADADAENEKVMEEVRAVQARVDRLEPIYIKKYGKKAYDKLWNTIRETYPPPPPLTPPPHTFKYTPLVGRFLHNVRLEKH